MNNKYIIYYQNNKLCRMRTLKSFAGFYGKKYAITLFDKFEQACVGKES